MKKFLFFLILLLPLFSLGQAIKVNVFNGTFYKTDNQDGIVFGVGYEKNLVNRIAVLAEYNFEVASENYYVAPYELEFTSGDTAYHTEYHVFSSYMELSYQSKFFFSDNANRAFYLSTGLALRHVKTKTETRTQEVEYYYNQPVYTDIENGSILFIPLSLKIGYRSVFDFFYQDFSFGISYIPGASTVNVGSKLVDTYSNESHFRNLSFNMSISVGFGWGY